ncbi:MAG TPA: response regulator [Allosphingosinicella sp.]|nr:response regulator [Allosphingosinicella sp.]
MIETLATFADQVTNMAREVGIEGKLGGHARVPGAAGLWRDLTDNVNQLAANLTTQVRAIAEVATAVTKGDLTRSIKVEAQGEVAALKDNINEMIVNLKDTTLKNAEQDWLKTNLAKFSRMLQGQKNMITVGRLILSELAPLVSAHHAVMYTHDALADPPCLTLLASYAYDKPGEVGPRFALGEGLVGQCAIEKQKILLTNVPENYIRVSSGLGSAAPANVMVLPIVFEGQVKAVLELASFEHFNPTHQAFLDQLTESIGIVLNTIEANMRTEDLLTQSQSLAQELQSRQEELQQTNQQLQEKAQLLAHQNVEVERKNQEVEQARQALEEKAEQLALTSKYKSEFLANMSHELRTPLNSLLILSDQLSKNHDGNLTPKQTEYCKTIHSSGNDLLMLINDILDLSKIESGTISIETGDMPLSSLKQHMERTFRQLAADKGLEFEVAFDDNLPETIRTDEKRLQQVVLNLLSNAFKFTEAGSVTLSARCVDSGWNSNHPVLRTVESAIEIAVTDTGIGIPEDKQKLIFEAFQQADATTSRKFGGTGLGLSISREIARLLGGELQVRSTPSQGSTFTLFVPLEAAAIVAPAGTTTARYENSGAAVPSAIPATLEVSDDRDSLGGEAFVLIVEDDVTFASILLDLARAAGLKGVVSTAGAGTLALARKLQPDAITLDLGLDDINGFVLLDLLKHDPDSGQIPIHVISGADEAASAAGLGAFGITGKPVDHDELAKLFRRIATQAKARRKRPPGRAKRNGAQDKPRQLPELAGAKVLIVDDDIRNIYSLTSVLESFDVEVLHAERGQDGILILEQTPGIDVALIDIMMPEMDGYETMRQIRERPGLADLPLISVTAKAMKGDRQKCLDAGASDYIAKPVDIELLLALLRVWIGKVRGRAAPAAGPHLVQTAAE